MRDRIVGVGVDPGRDAHEHAPPAARPLDVVQRVDDEEPTPAAAARAISSSDLLLPWNTIRSPAMPARIANSSSPSVETSAPSPSSAKSRSSATFGNALTLYATSASGAASR